jgi:hypothetical protein
VIVTTPIVTACDHARESGERNSSEGEVMNEVWVVTYTVTDQTPQNLTHGIAVTGLADCRSPTLTWPGPRCLDPIPGDRAVAA